MNSGGRHLILQARFQAMYTPSHFHIDDLPQLHALMRAHPLGALVTHGADGLDANHLPFELVATDVPQDGAAPALGTLRAHVARANPLWQGLQGGAIDARVMVVFRAEHAYVSPNGYPSKAVHHKAVPTWNYRVVQARGPLVVLDEAAAAHALVTRLTDRHEATQPKPWAVADAPADYVASMLRAIVCIEVPLTSLVGKFKLSQNRSAEDRAGLVGALRAQGDGPAQALAERMEHPAGG